MKNNNIEALYEEFKNNNKFEVSEISVFNDRTLGFIVKSNSGIEYLVANRSFNGPRDTYRVVAFSIENKFVCEEVLEFNKGLWIVNHSQKKEMQEAVSEFSAVINAVRDVQMVVHKRLTKHQNLVVQTIPMFV
jgi:hypothetical protein